MSGMKDSDTEKDAWFAPKRFGYGAGLPLNWQGWLVLGLVFAIVLAFALIFPQTQGATSILTVAAFLAGLAILIRITARKTRGGWRWRWGERD
jgi:hypothetical protein